MHIVSVLQRRALDKHLQHAHIGFSGMQLVLRDQEGLQLPTSVCPALPLYFLQQMDILCMAVMT